MPVSVTDNQTPADPGLMQFEPARVTVVPCRCHASTAGVVTGDMQPMYACVYMDDSLPSLLGSVGVQIRYGRRQYLGYYCSTGLMEKKRSTSKKKAR